VIWPCGKNAGLQKTKTGYGGHKGEKKRYRKTKEDLGELCDRCGQEERKDFSRYEKTGSR
jgi:hypothetical protein